MDFKLDVLEPTPPSLIRIHEIAKILGIERDEYAISLPVASLAFQDVKFNVTYVDIDELFPVKSS